MIPAGGRACGSGPAAHIAAGKLSRIGIVKRKLLTPRWMALHALFVVATIATGFLAVWQWDRAHDAGGSFQNLGYALQWPLFGVFTVCLWVWLLRMESRAGPDAEAANADVPDESGTAAAAPSTRRRPLVPPPASSVDEDEDPELAAYNRYLAELDEADRRDR